MPYAKFHTSEVGDVPSDIGVLSDMYHEYKRYKPDYVRPKITSYRHGTREYDLLKGLLSERRLIRYPSASPRELHLVVSYASWAAQASASMQSLGGTHPGLAPSLPGEPVR